MMKFPCFLFFLVFCCLSCNKEIDALSLLDKPTSIGKNTLQTVIDGHTIFKVDRLYKSDLFGCKSGVSYGGYYYYEDICWLDFSASECNGFRPTREISFRLNVSDIKKDTILALDGIRNRILATFPREELKYFKCDPDQPGFLRITECNDKVISGRFTAKLHRGNETIHFEHGFFDIAVD